MSIEVIDISSSYRNKSGKHDAAREFHHLSDDVYQKLQFDESNLRTSFLEDVSFPETYYKSGVLGSVTFLILLSDFHSRCSVSELERTIVPPIALKQFRVFLCAELPVGFASWALLDDDTHAGFVEGNRKLRPEDWRAGDNLWLIDVITPFGGTRQIIRHMRQAFPGVSGFAKRRYGVDRSDRVLSWKNDNV